MDLGVLPILLGERQVAWNWSEDDFTGTWDASNIQRCDFTIAILNGSQSDQRVLYEVGFSQGLGKPVFLIATSKRVKKTPRSLFSLTDVKLTEREALAFHLDAFLSTPHEKVVERSRQSSNSTSVGPTEPAMTSHQFYSQLEARVYEAIIQAGGSAIAEPENEKTVRRPDLLMWLASQDAELFDPAVIEIKSRIDSRNAKQVEQQLLDFIQASGVGCGFLLTEQEPPEKRRPLSPYVFWLSVDEFILLAQNGNLGHFTRRLRNRAAHGTA